MTAAPGAAAAAAAVHVWHCACGMSTRFSNHGCSMQPRGQPVCAQAARQGAAAGGGAQGPVASQQAQQQQPGGQVALACPRAPSPAAPVASSPSPGQGVQPCVSLCQVSLGAGQAPVRTQVQPVTLQDAVQGRQLLWRRLWQKRSRDGAGAGPPHGTAAQQPQQVQCLHHQQRAVSLLRPGPPTSCACCRRTLRVRRTW